MKRTCWDICATNSIVKSGQKDTEASIISMSESKSLFGDHQEMAHIWARIQAFDQVFKIYTVQTCS